MAVEVWTLSFNFWFISMSKFIVSTQFPNRQNEITHWKIFLVIEINAALISTVNYNRLMKILNRTHSTDAYKLIQWAIERHRFDFPSTLASTARIRPLNTKKEWERPRKKRDWALISDGSRTQWAQPSYPRSQYRNKWIYRAHLAHRSSVLSARSPPQGWPGRTRRSSLAAGLAFAETLTRWRSLGFAPRSPRRPRQEIWKTSVIYVSQRTQCCRICRVLQSLCTSPTFFKTLPAISYRCPLTEV